MDPQARTNFPAFLLTCGEGFKDYGYPDQRGNITVAAGDLVPSLAAFSRLDWRNPDGSVASPMQVQTAWTVLQRAAAYVKTADPKTWPGGGHYAGLTTIRATRASLDALIESTIDSFEATLRTYWPGWDDAPGPAQEALMRIAWAVGPAHLDTRWPKLHAAWVARDWETCAVESRIPELDATEPAANEAEAELFRSAVEWQAPQS